LELILRSKAEAPRTRAEDSLVWLLGFLAGNANDPWATTIGVDELQRLVEADPEVSRLLTPYSATLSGDVFVIVQCLRQINLYQPWARTFPKRLEGDPAKVKELRSAIDAKCKASVDFLDQLQVWNFKSAAKVAAPFKPNFQYPIEKRRTKENVAALREAERNLDAFWGCIDRIIQKKIGNLDGTATRRLLFQNRALQRTPEWIEPASKGGTKPTPTLDPQDVIYKPLSTVYFGLEPDPISQPAALRPSRRKKTKTKGRAQLRKDDTTHEPKAASPGTLIPEPVEPQPTLPVDARALKVFRVLFHNPDITSTPGEIAWTDFLHAMTSMGFLVQKLYGSSWLFKPTRSDMNKMNAIQFHEPHPKGKLPFRTARGYGRRLQRAYGWCGGMFVLREK
jgi:hypothetical protein